MIQMDVAAFNSIAWAFVFGIVGVAWAVAYAARKPIRVDVNDHRRS